MTIQKEFELKLPQFVDAFPDDANAYKLRSGTWKFGFDSMSCQQIEEFLRTIDGRPRLSSEIFTGFKNFKILEFGPSDGYNTAQLELYGAKSILSIEANADAFLRCLILKNALNLRAKFLLGDFLKYIDTPNLEFDLAYASGILYHLQDPVSFVLKCSKFAKHLFIWSFYFDEASIAAHPYEKRRFIAHEERKIGGEDFVYHRRSVDPDILSRGTYQGGIEEVASWLSLDDLKKALRLAGYEIAKTIPDEYSGTPAMNIWASKA